MTFYALHLKTPRPSAARLIIFDDDWTLFSTVSGIPLEDPYRIAGDAIAATKPGVDLKTARIHVCDAEIVTVQRREYLDVEVPGQDVGEGSAFEYWYPCPFCGEQAEVTGTIASGGGRWGNPVDVDRPREACEHFEDLGRDAGYARFRGSVELIMPDVQIDEARS